jgi:hypothetical protein
VIPCVSMTRLVCSLDRWECACDYRPDFEDALHVHLGHECKIEDDALLTSSLSAAVYSFSIRWIRIVAPGRYTDEMEYDELIRALWFEARDGASKCIGRPSYRSVLTLYLFGMTPVPTNVSASEAKDGLTGEVGIELAIRQLHDLRAKRRGRQFIGSKITTGADDTTPSGTSRPLFNDDFIQQENIAFVAGMIFDTSFSLSMGRPSILCAGILGFLDDPQFQLLITRARIFHQDSEEMRRPGFVATEQAAHLVVQSASAWKLIIFKAVSVLREGVVYGHDESHMEKVRIYIDQILGILENTYVPVLDACERSIHLMSQEIQLQWCKFNIDDLSMVALLRNLCRHAWLAPQSCDSNPLRNHRYHGKKGYSTKLRDISHQISLRCHKIDRICYQFQCKSGSHLSPII